MARTAETDVPQELLGAGDHGGFTHVQQAIICAVANEPYAVKLWK